MRYFFRLLLVVIILLGAAWIGLWWYAQGRMQAGLTGWVGEMNQNPDVKFTYDSVTRSNSPLVAKVTLTNLRATGQAPDGGGAIVITVPSVALRIDPANPLEVHVDLPPQINVSAARGDASVTFGSTDFIEHLDPKALFNANISPYRSSDGTASNINLLASGGSLLVLHIDSFALHGTLDRTAGAGQAAIAGTEVFNGIALSPLLTKLGSIPFDGKIQEFGVNLNVSGPLPANFQDFIQQLNAIPLDDEADREKMTFTALHNWAAAGGSGNIGISLVVGPSTMNADASVKFDANVQPSGTADLTADHLDAFTAAVTAAYPQTQDSVNQAQAQLSPYLSTTDTGGQTLTVHVTYGNGAVNINGQKVTDMPPLDWDTLENPPPPAPDDGSAAGQ